MSTIGQFVERAAELRNSLLGLVYDELDELARRAGLGENVTEDPFENGLIGVYGSMLIDYPRIAGNIRTINSVVMGAAGEPVLVVARRSHQFAMSLGCLHEGRLEFDFTTCSAPDIRLPTRFFLRISRGDYSGTIYEQRGLPLPITRQNPYGLPGASNAAPDTGIHLNSRDRPSVNVIIGEKDITEEWLASFTGVEYLVLRRLSVAAKKHGLELPLPPPATDDQSRSLILGAQVCLSNLDGAVTALAVDSSDTGQNRESLIDRVVGAISAARALGLIDPAFENIKID